MCWERFQLQRVCGSSNLGVKERTGGILKHGIASSVLQRCFKWNWERSLNGTKLTLLSGTRYEARSLAAETSMLAGTAAWEQRGDGPHIPYYFTFPDTSGLAHVVDTFGACVVEERVLARE